MAGGRPPAVRCFLGGRGGRWRPGAAGGGNFGVTPPGGAIFGRRGSLKGGRTTPAQKWCRGGRLPGGLSGRRAFWAALLAQGLCVAPKLAFFWHIFGLSALALWMLLSLWVGLFVLLYRQATLRLPWWAWSLACAALWSGCEYFRCELYPW